MLAFRFKFCPNKTCLTLELRWALKVSSVKQRILGQILHLKTDFICSTQSGTPAGIDAFSVVVLDFVTSAPCLLESSLSSKISSPFPILASSSFREHAPSKCCQKSKKRKTKKKKGRKFLHWMNECIWG